MIVYIYTFPNGKKYVGQTSRTLEERARQGDGYVNSPAYGLRHNHYSSGYYFYFIEENHEKE